MSATRPGTEDQPASPRMYWGTGCVSNLTFVWWYITRSLVPSTSPAIESLIKSASKIPKHHTITNELSVHKMHKTQIVNKYCQGNKSEGRPPHEMDPEFYKCDGHTDAFPKWGCRLLIDGVLMGHAMDYRNKPLAKEEACRQAVEALGLSGGD
jgi:Double-stranded RNA binding motif